MKSFIKKHKFLGRILISSALLNSQVEPSTITGKIVTGLIWYQHFDVDSYVYLFHHVNEGDIMLGI